MLDYNIGLLNVRITYISIFFLHKPVISSLLLSELGMNIYYGVNKAVAE